MNNSELPIPSKDVPLDFSKITYFVHKKDGSMEVSHDPYRRDYVSMQDFNVVCERYLELLHSLNPKDVLRDEPSAKQRVLSVHPNAVAECGFGEWKIYLFNQGGVQQIGISEVSQQAAWESAASKLSPVLRGESLAPVEATGSEAPKSIEPIFEELLWAKYGGGESMTREGFTAALDEFVNQIL